MYLIRRVAVVIALGSTFLRCTAQVTTSCNPLDGKLTAKATAQVRIHAYWFRYLPQ